MTENRETASHISDFSNNSARTANILVLLLWIMLGMVILRTAWVSDDAYISFRTVDNFVNGYGLRWNVDERVQSFTNPLWVLLISIPYAITGEIYYTSIFFSLLIVLLTALLIARRIAVSPYAALIAFTGLICSKAFIDYSTSGLEQPLLYFLFALFIWRYAKFDGHAKTFGKLVLIASLSAVTRMDTLLLYGPALLALFWQCRSWKAVKYGLLGFIPFISWELFSILYYGFPFPNTYYAKLHAGIPAEAMTQQGFIYYLETLNADPITLLVIVSATVLTLFRRICGYAAIGLGIALYLYYIVKVGGDFMSGRFFALPLLGSCILLSRYAWDRTQLVGAIAVMLLVGFMAPYPTLLSNSAFGASGNNGINPTGIADERGWYYQKTGLLRVKRDTEMPEHEWAQKGKIYSFKGDVIEYESCVGFTGYFAGPRVHIFDGYALTEPLLARLPVNLEEKWRIGHLPRTAPFGYRKTLEKDSNQIADSNLAIFYNKLSLITRGNIFSAQRLQAIAAMNRGKYDYLLKNYWDETPKEITYQKFSTPKADGSPWNAPDAIIIRRGDLFVTLDSVSHSPTFETSCDHNDYYAIKFFRDTVLLGRIEILKRVTPAGNMHIEKGTVPDLAQKIGYNRVHLIAVSGDDAYSFGHLRLLDTVLTK